MRLVPWIPLVAPLVFFLHGVTSALLTLPLDPYPSFLDLVLVPVSLVPGFGPGTAGCPPLLCLWLRLVGDCRCRTRGVITSVHCVVGSLPLFRKLASLLSLPAQSALAKDGLYLRVSEHDDLFVGEGALRAVGIVA